MSPKPGNHSAGLRFNNGCSAIFRVVLAVNVLEPVLAVPDIGIRSNFGFRMKANPLRGEF